MFYDVDFHLKCNHYSIIYCNAMHTIYSSTRLHPWLIKETGVFTSQDDIPKALQLIGGGTLTLLT